MSEMQYPTQQDRIEGCENLCSIYLGKSSVPKESSTLRLKKKAINQLPMQPVVHGHSSNLSFVFAVFYMVHSSHVLFARLKCIESSSAFLVRSASLPSIC